MKFSEIIIQGLGNYKDNNQDEEANAATCFRGSNTPLLFQNDFVCDSSAHCPRIAMMRRAKKPTDHPKTFKDWASHMHGRAMEELLKKLVACSQVPDLTTREEEDYKVTLENEDNQLMYSARPDLVTFMKGQPKSVCEFKSVQSNSTAEQVFVAKKPKLGAAIQVAAQMHFHEINAGTIVYVLGYWVDGYSFATKSKFKLQPAMTTFECKFNSDGWLEVEGRQTIVSRDGIENGIILLNDLWKARQMPIQRPKSRKLEGSESFSVCDYCAYGARETHICDTAESFQDGLKLETFMEIVEDKLGVK